MLKPGQATPRVAPGPHPAVRVGSATAHVLLRLVVRPLLAILVLGVLGVFGMALRLASGPVDVTWAVHAFTPVELGGRTNGMVPFGHSWGVLDIGRVRLDWHGFHDGRGAPVMVRLEDVTIRRPDGPIVDHVDRIRISLAAAPLLRAQLAITEIDVSGARLNLRRDGVNGIDLGLGPVGRRHTGGNSGPVVRWSELSRVHVSDMQVAVHDLVVGQDWTVRDVGIDARPPGTSEGMPGQGGIVGRFGATLRIAGRQAALRGSGTTGTDRGDILWHVTLDPIVPADLVGELPMLAPLLPLALPVAPVLDVTFANGPGRFMEPIRASVSARLGQGEVHEPGTVLRVASGLIRLDADMPDQADGAFTVRLQQADLKLRDASDPDRAATGPELHAHGTMSLDQLADPMRIRAAVSVDIPHIGFPGLAQYWPRQAAGGARRWITANITDGEAHNLHVESTLASDQGWSKLAETGRTGGFDATGLTLWWLRPIAPLRDMQARLTFQGTDAVLIEAPHAVMPVDTKPEAVAGLHQIMVSAGSMRIAGLNAKDQVATIKAHLAGSLPDLLAELSHPRLRLLSRHPLPFTDPAGHSETDLELVLPLVNDISVDQLHVHARSLMTNVHLGNVAAGRALDQANLSLSATADGLSLDGTGAISGIASVLHYAMDFREGPPEQVTEQAHVEGVVTTETAKREGLDPSDNVDGSGRLAIDYAAHRSGVSEVSLGLDLADLGVSTRVWSKPRGRPADVSATIALNQGHLVSIERIHAAGPGLVVEAHAVVAGGRASQVVVGHFELGRSSGAGRIDLPHGTDPKQAIRVSVKGPVLDLSTVIDSSRPKLAQAKPPVRHARHAPVVPQPWIADLAFDRVFVAKKTMLSGVEAHLQDDGRRIELARLDAHGPTTMSVRLTPDRGGRHLIGSTSDLGLLLHALGVTDALSGGTLRLDARFDDETPDAPLSGTAEIGRFVVRDAPLAARILRNLSIYGWLTALPSPQLAVTRLVAPFTLAGNVVTLTDARAHSAAIGVTLRGPIDLGRGQLDLKGTVVPAWAINQLPGRLPVVGHLLSPEKDGGVLAATLSIKGPLSGPDVHVNALSALAPGFLRRLLFE
ncbi:MAG: AsmA-like C-terminal region-containing protein [Janthinobacterium lividum]